MAAPPPTISPAEPARRRRSPLLARCLGLLLSLPLLVPPLARAQDGEEVKACRGETCPMYCRDLDLPTNRFGQCVTQCRQSCAEHPPADPPPVTLTPKYVIQALVYAPPGCTSGPGAQCGTGNGSSFVDYGQGSSNGTKITTKDSFQLGVTISYDNSSLVDAIGGGGSYGFSETHTDSTAVNVTKSSTFDLKVQGNGDGIDHGQDVFLLLLKPTVTLKKHGDTILWSFSSGGTPYEVYVSELRQPSTMRPAVAKVLNEVGLTRDDYNAILANDPFGGTVAEGGGTAVGGIVVTGGVFTTGEPPALDSRRFWYTGWSFPYEPTKASTSCNNGVCSCVAITDSFTNDKVTTTSADDTGQTTVDFYGDVGIPKVWSLKIDTKMVWTTSATTDNSTESKETASATITCPSVGYAGDTAVAVYWDSRFGSFLFMPYDPGAAPLIQRGRVLDATGRAVAGKLVSMRWAGKTLRTFTAPDGSYGFPSWTGKPPARGKAMVVIGKLRRSVDVGVSAPTVLRLR